MKIILCIYAVLVVVLDTSSDSVKPITDIASWNHPVKKYLYSAPYHLYRLELTKNNTFPTFYTEKPDWKMLDDRKQIIQWLNDIAQANAYWDYQLINKKDSLSLKVVCNRDKKQILEIVVNNATYFVSDSLPFNRRIGKKRYLSQRIKKLLTQSKYSIPYDKICDYVENDYDLDGKNEIAIALLDSYDNDCSLPQYSHIYFFKINDSSIDSIGESVSGAEIFCSLKEIKLENERKPFIYCRTTNGFCGMFGYTIFTFQNNHPRIKDAVFSSTGAGSDYLEDMDNNGYYDMHIQERTIYGFSVKTSYDYIDHRFDLASSEVSLEETTLLSSDAKQTIKTAIAIKYFLSADAEEIYKVRNDNELKNSFEKICSAKRFPEVTTLNSLVWADIAISIKKHADVFAVAELIVPALEIDAQVTLEKVDQRWVIRNVVNLPDP